MTIDIRATVTCSLGTLISASIADEYVQGVGLIKCRGSCELSGIATPALGTAVTFSYTKGGVTRTIPRKLRVLSSFADPFRRTTSVELGCKLTYLEDKRESIDWTAFDDPDNTLTEADAKIITIPIRAQAVAQKCMSELGISGSFTLTNKFSVAEFDLSPGYVQVLSDLLVSESLCGYLDANETLQVFQLDQPGGAGPVLDSSLIVDIAKIGVGQLPGEAVTVSYNTLKLKKPGALNTENPGESEWDYVYSANRYEVPVQYMETVVSGGPVGGGITSTTTITRPATAIYNISEVIQTTTYYKEIDVERDGKTEKIRVVSFRITNVESYSASVAGAIITEYLSNGFGFNNQKITKETTESFAYDKAGNETFFERQTKGSVAYIIGSTAVPFVIPPNDIVSIDLSQVVPLDAELRYTVTLGNRQQISTYVYGPWAQTIQGQQTIAAAQSFFSFENSTDVKDFLARVYNISTGFFSVALPSGRLVSGRQGLYLIEHRVTTELKSEPQTAPNANDIINATNADGGDPNNGFRTESTAELELALGSATAQRRIEFSLPYAPDDTFVKIGASYSSVASDAPQKARRYGVVQNRLLLGNRSGMNIQTAPELLPSTPFAAFLVEANGVSGLYRTNGTTWTMSSEGVVVSTDALFWGAVGGTGDFFFPVAPGITELPVTPPAVDGVVTVPSVVPVWNEKALLDARTRTICSVVGLSFALQLNTPLTLVTKTKASVVPVLYVNAPAASVALAALAPAVSTGASVAVPVAAVSVAAVAPAVQTALAVEVPAATVTVAALVPEQVGRPRIEVLVPAAVIEVAGLLPVVLTGTFLEVPAAQITITALPPRIGGPDFWSSWAQQNYGWWPESYGEWWAN